MYYAMKYQPFETKEHDLTGYAALDFGNDGFASFTSLFANYNPTRFEPVTLKLSFASGCFTITLYALDKIKQEQTINQKKLPVKKIKMVMEAPEFAKHIYRLLPL